MYTLWDISCQLFLVSISVDLAQCLPDNIFLIFIKWAIIKLHLILIIIYFLFKTANFPWSSSYYLLASLFNTSFPVSFSVACIDSYGCCSSKSLVPGLGTECYLFFWIHTQEVKIDLLLYSSTVTVSSWPLINDFLPHTFIVFQLMHN